MKKEMFEKYLELMDEIKLIDKVNIKTVEPYIKKYQELVKNKTLIHACYPIFK